MADKQPVKRPEQCYFDTHGRNWRLEINAYERKRVLGELGVDLYQLFDSTDKVTDPKDYLIGRLIDDDELFIDILAALCNEQREERGLSLEDFLRGLGGDALTEATDALFEAAKNFCRGPRRKRAEAIIQLIQTTDRRATAKIQQILESPEIAQHIDKELDAIFAKQPLSQSSGLSSD